MRVWHSLLASVYKAHTYAAPSIICRRFHNKTNATGITYSFQFDSDLLLPKVYMLASPYRRLSIPPLPVVRPQTIRDSAGSMQSLHSRCHFFEPCIEPSFSAAANWLPKVWERLKWPLLLPQYLQSSCQQPIMVCPVMPESKLSNMVT